MEIKTQKYTKTNSQLNKLVNLAKTRELNHLLETTLVSYKGGFSNRVVMDLKLCICYSCLWDNLGNAMYL